MSGVLGQLQECIELLEFLRDNVIVNNECVGRVNTTLDRSYAALNEGLEGTVPISEPEPAVPAEPVAPPAPALEPEVPEDDPGLTEQVQAEQLGLTH